jgi:putative hemolysin
MSTKLFNTEDFTFGRKGLFARLVSKFILWALGGYKANRAYENIMNQPTQDFDVILREIQLKVDVDQKSISNIPATGPVVIICNHPTGIPDGIVMIEKGSSYDYCKAISYEFDPVERFK